MPLAVRRFRNVIYISWNVLIIAATSVQFSSNDSEPFNADGNGNWSVFQLDMLFFFIMCIEASVGVFTERIKHLDHLLWYPNCCTVVGRSWVTSSRGVWLVEQMWHILLPRSQCTLKARYPDLPGDMYVKTIYHLFTWNTDWTFQANSTSLLLMSY